MNKKEWSAITHLFEKCETLPPTEWEETILGQYSSDSPIAQKTLEMLKSQQDATKYFDDFGEELFQEVDSMMEQKLPPGTQIGKYTILKELGSGGMATVYLAERKEGDYAQKVAIKTLKEKVVSPEAIHHFRQEQQMLASLNHPHIAQIYDGGITENGIAYFIMEWIEGLPVDQYADKHKLSFNERIKLFSKITEAVQFAHQHFILHQDIKPSNILVSQEGHIKLLDFGISKLIQQQEEDHLTSKNFMGTFAYASPEQLSGQSVTTASDIYQLGILLYKLLYGKLPYEEQDLSNTKRSLKEVNQGRKVVLDIGSTPKELSAIIHKTTKNAPGLRYQTVNELQQDLNAFQHHFPVAAFKGNTFYKGKKYIRRHRGAFISASFLLIALLSGLISSLYQAKIAKRERDKALMVSDFLKEVFTSNDPYQSKRNLTAHDLLESGVEKLDRSDLPIAIKVELQELLGRLYFNIGDYDESIQELKTAIGNYKNHESALPDSLYFILLDDVGGSYMGKSLYAKADSFFRLSRFALHQSADVQEFNKHLGIIYKDIANAKRGLANYDSALFYINKSIAILPKENKASLTSAFGAKASLYRSLSKLDSSAIFFDKAIGLAQNNYDSQSLEILYNDYGILLEKQGKYKRSIQYLQNSIKINQTKHKSQNPAYARTMTNIGGSYYKLGNYSKADSCYEIALHVFLNNFDSANSLVLSTRYNMANVFYSSEDFKKALTQYQEVLKADIKNLGAYHPYVAGDYTGVAKCYTKLKQFTKAKNLIGEAYAIYERKLGKDSQKISYCYSLYAILYEEMGRPLVAANYYKKAYEHANKNLGPDHPYTKEYYHEWKRLINEKRGKKVNS